MNCSPFYRDRNDIPIDDEITTIVTRTGEGRGRRRVEVIVRGKTQWRIGVLARMLEEK